MKKNQILGALTVIALSATLLAGCGNKYTTDSDCPFTELDWTATVDDMLELYGDDYETYDSIYAGTTYTYETEYDGENGIVKYMFDGKEKLMCVAFVYTSDTAEDVLAVYDRIHSGLVEDYGESGYSANTTTNYGDTWYRDEGDIVIAVWSLESSEALQYSYLNPVVSHYQMLEQSGGSTDDDDEKTDWNEL